MWKLIIGLLIIGAGANAKIEVKMNKKALYDNAFDLMTDNQKDYIYDNTDIIIKETNDILKTESKDIQKEKFIDESNAIEFNLTPDGNTSNFKYLMRSNEGRFDRLSKKVFETAVKKYPLPKEKTLIRLLFEYKVGKGKIENQRRNEQTKSNETYSQLIQRGTTRFEHSMSQQVMEFETSKDGFINTIVNPRSCAEITILTKNNQKVTGGLRTIFQHSDYNIEVPKGSYKLLVQTKETCNVNIQYP